MYGKQFTHEARLIVDRETHDIRYNNKQYEGQMAYFNQITRPALYHGQECVRHRLGLESSTPHEWEHNRYRCYDCTAFQAIIGEYLLQSGTIKHSNLNYTVIEAE